MRVKRRIWGRCYMAGEERIGLCPSFGEFGVMVHAVCSVLLPPFVEPFPFFRLFRIFGFIYQRLAAHCAAIQHN